MNTAGDRGPTRRNVIVTGTAATVLLLAGRGRSWGANVRLRPDISSAAGEKMLELYEAAVVAMQDPEINYPPQPQSWTFQAYMHMVPRNPFDPANSGSVRNGTAALKTRVDQIYREPEPGTVQAAWKQAALECWGTCTHRRSYFTTWHRWYLHYFERICRKMCGDPNFMLPYWNYASDIGASLQIPAKFRDPTSRLIFNDRGLGFANPQGAGDQNVAMNNGGYMPFRLVDYKPALSTNVMFPSAATFADPGSPAYNQMGFAGRVESSPHDLVHDGIGGWMGNVPSSAGDPIFYMHHCQIDRLYASWEAESGATYNWGNTDTQPDEQTWKGVPGAFVDETGALVKVKLGDAIDTEALGYSYDSLAAPPSPELISLAMSSKTPSQSPLKLAAMRAEKFRVVAGGASVTLSEEPPIAAAPSVARKTSPATLVLSGITLLRRPPAPLSVFVNLPKDAAPELNGPYYVGTLSLFNFDLDTGAPMAHDESGAHNEASFDVSQVLQQQRLKGLWDGGPITVTVATIGADRPGTTTYLEIGKVSLVP